VVGAVAFSPDGLWAASAGGNDNAIHLWDPLSGKRAIGPDKRPLRLAGNGKSVLAVGFQADGQAIAWGNEASSRDGNPQINNRGPLQFSLVLPSGSDQSGVPMRLPAEQASPFRRASANSGDWSLRHRKGNDYGYIPFIDLVNNGAVRTTIALNAIGLIGTYSYTFAPGGNEIISGNALGTLAAFDTAAKVTGVFTGHDGDVLAVSTSPEGRYLVSGSADQTVRLWNLKTRELLVSLFRGADGEWVMWTPQGFYASSPAGARLIGWQINHGPEHEAEYVAAAQLREHLNRPDIVARAIQLASAEEAVRQARGADFKVADLLAKPVPRLRILSPEAGAALKGGRAQVTVELEATPDPVKLIRIQVNGVQVPLPEHGGLYQAGSYTFDAPLGKGENKIAIAAQNDTGETVASVSIAHEGEGDLDKRGTLYVLAIGVDKYPNLPGNNLQYAGADAKAFAEAMEKRAGALHQRVVKRVLTNGGAASDAPTRANIEDALDMLRGAKQNDTVMLFVSGHGVNDGPNYRFVPTDAARGEQSLLKPSSAVSWYAFQDALTGANGRRILFLDTCHSANAFNARLLGDSYEANIMVYSSARGDQEAKEDPTLGGGHGLFTYALVEGVNGAARDGAGEVRADGLRDFLKGRVGALAAQLKHEQEPQYFRARDAENYVLARP
jgi:hypothetical protein